MASKSRGPSAKAYYARYKAENRFAANRKRKLLKALKEQPNNKQIEQALKNITYRRKTPNTSVWSSGKRKTAGLFKQFTGCMSFEVFNSNPIVKTNAINKLNSGVKSIHTKVTNRLGDRAHDKLGNLVWK